MGPRPGPGGCCDGQVCRCSRRLLPLSSPQVQNEVFVMHQVRSPSVLAFHAWYETRNHLWVITELCAGRLDAIVAADSPLAPEAVQVSPTRAPAIC